MQENKLLLPVSIIIAGALIGGALYFSNKNKNVAVNSGDPQGQVAGDSAQIKPVDNEDHIIGSKNADLVIVEYSDTECPFCKSFHSTMKEVVTTYEGRVAWVYRQFPIAQLHSRAIKEAEATECAAELGGNQGFWNYVDKVFETTNSNDSLDPAELPKIAVAVGLEEAAFNECLSSGKYSEFINKSVEEAIVAGARGTPYSVIISKSGEKVVINGAEPIASVKAKIDALLK